MNNLDKDFLIKHITDTYGEEYVAKILNGFTNQRVSSFRINRLKSNKEEVEKSLKVANISYESVDNILDAYVTDNENSVKELDIYNDGKIYLQSLSSMLPPLILNPLENDHILDMAAAPGSKTSQIAALTNNACITAVEMNPMRAEKLKYNLNKLGVTRTTVLVKDARLLDDFFRFDKILLDAPCSGSGTIYLNEETKQRISMDVIKKCQQRQIALLRKGLSLLPKNGELVYSTCSIFKEENEEVVRSVLNKNIEIVPLKLTDIEHLEFLPSLEGTITVMPNKYFEGFFIAKLRKI